MDAFPTNGKISHLEIILSCVLIVTNFLAFVSIHKQINTEQIDVLVYVFDYFLEGYWNGSYSNLLLEYARFWIYDENFPLVYGNY